MVISLTYIERTSDQKLLLWAQDNSRKPLVLRGARQVGKTALARQLAQSANLSLCELNFERQPRLRHLFEKAGDLSPRILVPQLEALLEIDIRPGKTLLFLDEIQECPQAISFLRYLYEVLPALHVIAAGSLLEFALQRVSTPVGRVTFSRVHPMSFEEFLKATGRSALCKHRPKLEVTGEDSLIATALHEAFMEALREYFIVGGMPACVAEFSRNRSFSKVREIQSDIVQTYLSDVRKYARGDSQISNVDEVMANAFSFVGKQISYTALGHGDAIKRTKQSVQLLAQAQILHVVRSSSAAKPPLAAESDDKTFKLVFLDIGLGQCLSGIKPADLINAASLAGTHEGRLAEQFIGQELLASCDEASEGGHLFYWKRNARGSSAEVDYLLSRSGKIIPVEVKSGVSGRLRSLHLYLQNYGGQGICLQEISRCSRDGNVRFFPIYSALQ
jgi:predicted AAA+ superfamily ATPase